MSTPGLRDFRPKLHFTPPKGWMNDPNGLVYVNGVYHLFYQYHPNSTVWGPMHWGHATSEDLIHWTHQPIALYPDRYGAIFSGSAVYDEANTSGLGAFGKAPIVAVYTVNQQMDDRFFEENAIAYSLDGVRFAKYEGNPVLPNPGSKDFRDPKVFWNPIKACWSMVLAAGRQVWFYASPNLKTWEKTGEFSMAGVPSGGIAGPKLQWMQTGEFIEAPYEATCVWECPDLFPLQTPEGEKWVLIASMMPMPHQHLFSRTEYFVGSFDGDTFHWDGNFTQPAWVDDGFDNYAGVTFNGTDDKRIFIGMGCNWAYERNEPTGDYSGIMTLPRQLALVRTPKSGWRLGASPLGVGAAVMAARTVQSGAILPDEVFALEIEGDGEGEVRLENAVGQVLRFGVNASNALFVDRSAAGDNHFDLCFASEEYSRRQSPRFFTGPFKMQAVFDVSQLEVFIDEGTVNMSANMFPDAPYTRLFIEGGWRVRLCTLKA